MNTLMIMYYDIEYISCMKTLMIMRSHHTVKKKIFYTFFTNEVTVFTYCHLLLFYAVRFLLSFKGTVQRDFRPPAGPLNNGLKHFRVWLKIH